MVPGKTKVKSKGENRLALYLYAFDITKSSGTANLSTDIVLRAKTKIGQS